MEAIQKEHDRVWSTSKKTRTIDATQSIIDQLRAVRNAITADSTSAQVTLAKAQGPVKSAFDDMTTSLKTTRGGHNNYQKALDKLFRDKSIPSNEIDALQSHSTLVNRAIYLHLLREGLFDVASTLQEEADQRSGIQQSLEMDENEDVTVEHPLGLDKTMPDNIPDKFQNMHYILRELKQEHNLQPAIDWARQNSHVLETRGSNLEFELCRLQYVSLLLEDCEEGVLSVDSQMRALSYAQSEFQHFRTRYLVDIQQLMGAMAFATNLEESPYYQRLYNTSAWDEVATSFTREFCSLLELSADSPLYIAATAGAIALPQLLKLQAIQKQKKAEWTTENELPVETPLPPNFQYHSIFVCPVSKEQSTDQNPPMMIPCGHVVCQESLQRLSKGAKFKCPYCPIESHPEKARRVFL